MNSIRKFASLGLVGTGLALASALPVQAAEAGKAGLARASAQTSARAYPGESFSQYYGRRYGGHRGYRRGYGGGAVAAGVIGGLAVGALAAGTIANSGPGYGYGPGYYGGPGIPVAGPGVPVGNVYGADPNWVNYCASRYRSFDPRSGTYLANDGYRYPCQ